MGRTKTDKALRRRALERSVAARPRNQRVPDLIYLRWRARTPCETIDLRVFTFLDIGTSLYDVMSVTCTVIPSPKGTTATHELTHKGNVNYKTIVLRVPRERLYYVIPREDFGRMFISSLGFHIFLK